MTPPKTTAEDHEKAVLSEFRQYWDNMPSKQIEALEVVQMLNNKKIEAIDAISKGLDIPMAVKNQIAICENYPGEILANQMIAYFKHELEQIPNMPHRIEKQTAIYESMLHASKLCNRHSQTTLDLITDNERETWERLKDALELVYLGVKRLDWFQGLTAAQRFLVRVFATLDNVDNDKQAKQFNTNGKRARLKTRNKRIRPTEKQASHRETDYETAIKHMEQNGYPSESIEMAKQEYKELLKFIENKYSI